MSLTITIDRTKAGHYRAEVAEHPQVVFEHDELSGLVDELKRSLDFLIVNPDGTMMFGEAIVDEAAARAAVERTALRHEELDQLIERYPVPPDWGDEPGWSDAL